MNILAANALVQFSGWIGTLLLFGGKKIPELMRGIGKGIKEFKDGIGSDDHEKSEDTSNKK